MEKTNKEKRETNWNECLFYKRAKRITPDMARSRFLIKTSLERVEFLQTLEITDLGANFIFESYYTSIIELLQSITIADGYNILNHLCLGYYLRDILKEESLFRSFDSCRFKRNGLVYYGKMMGPEIARYSIEQARRLIEELKSLINKKSQ